MDGGVPLPSSPFTIRDCTVGDLTAVRDIYAVHAGDPESTVTFEETAPSVEEMTGRWREIVGKGFAFIVAQDAEGVVGGYAYCKPFRSRPAYRFTVEESVYVSPAFSGRGVGRALLGELLDRCAGLGLRSVVAVLGTEEDNPASAALHRKLGFRSVGVMEDCGWKAGRWVSRLIMERLLVDKKK